MVRKCSLMTQPIDLGNLPSLCAYHPFLKNPSSMHNWTKTKRKEQKYTAGTGNIKFILNNLFSKFAFYQNQRESHSEGQVNTSLFSFGLSHPPNNWGHQMFDKVKDIQLFSSERKQSLYYRLWITFPLTEAELERGLSFGWNIIGSWFSKFRGRKWSIQPEIIVLGLPLGVWQKTISHLSWQYKHILVSQQNYHPL